MIDGVRRCLGGRCQSTCAAITKIPQTVTYKLTALGAGNSAPSPSWLSAGEGRLSPGCSFLLCPQGVAGVHRLPQAPFTRLQSSSCPISPTRPTLRIRFPRVTPWGTATQPAAAGDTRFWCVCESISGRGEHWRWPREALTTVGGTARSTQGWMEQRRGQGCLCLDLRPSDVHRQHSCVSSQQVADGQTSEPPNRTNRLSQEGSVSVEMYMPSYASIYIHRTDSLFSNTTD